MKVLFRHYTSYGKGDNECLKNQWVEEDTPEARKSIIDEYDWFDWNSDQDDFINGKVDEISYWSSDDWDCPTGGCFTVTSRDKAFEEVEKDYESSKNNLKRLFKEEN